MQGNIVSFLITVFDFFSEFVLITVSLIYAVVKVIVNQIVTLFPFAVNQVGVHSIVGIIKADVPGTHAMLGFLVEVDTQV